MGFLNRQWLGRTPLLTAVMLVIGAFGGWTAADGGVVTQYGRLSASGNKIVGEKSGGSAVQLKGPSMQWSVDGWGSDKFFKAEVINALVDGWGAQIIRMPLGIDFKSQYGEVTGGYITKPSENWSRVKTAVDAAIAKDVYAIVDWHAHNAHESNIQAKAIEFFTSKDLAGQYGNNPAVIFEIFNEPDGDVTWAQAKAYSNAVISAIRNAGFKNLILIGTPNWDQNPETAAKDPPTDPENNIAFVCHFYAATHKLSTFRTRINSTLNTYGKPVFISEWGATAADGSTSYDFTEADKWHAYLDSNKISSCAWGVTAGGGLSDYWTAANNPLNVSGNDMSKYTNLDKMTEHGKYIFNWLKKKTTVPSGGIVSQYGRLSASGNKIVGENSGGKAVQLKGPSMHWSVISSGGLRSGEFFKTETVNALVDGWGAQIIRVPLGIDYDNQYGKVTDGYITKPDENWARVKTVVDAAIAKDVYVIVDWHAHNAHESNIQAKAIDFFTNQNRAGQYGNKPGVIFEIYNEPTTTPWAEVKAYSNAVISAIRNAGFNNLILVGTPIWDQDPETAAKDPPNDNNIAFVCHFYAADTNQVLSKFRPRINSVLNTSGKPVFVSEWGATHSDGSTKYDFTEADRWHAYLDSNKISSCAWGVTAGGSLSDFWTSANSPLNNASNYTDLNKMTEHGKYVYNWLKKKNTTSILSVTGDLSGSANSGVATVAMPPITVLSAEFAVGPNPSGKSSKSVNFYRQGNRITNAELFIYDASGNVVKKVGIKDNAAVGDNGKRSVGSWDLTDKKGRTVPEGTYLVKGTITTKDGKKEKVSAVVGIR